MSTTKIQFNGQQFDMRMSVHYGGIATARQPGIYAMVGSHDFEVGCSTKEIAARIRQRPRDQWATHIGWLELRDLPSLSDEAIFLIEATCIHIASKTQFLGKRLRNTQFTKSLGRFEGRKDPLQTVSYRFLSAFEKSYVSFDGCKRSLGPTVASA